VVVDVLKSLGVIDQQNKPRVVSTSSKGPMSPDWKPYAASSFGGTSQEQGKALDSFLSQSSLKPIELPDVRHIPGKRRAVYGPVDAAKARMAAESDTHGFGRATPDFTGMYSDGLMSMYSDPFLANNFSMFNFALSRVNPYMTNRTYGAGMYGDIPVYFLMMQEQNGGLLYWPISIREKYQWFRYFARCFYADKQETLITLSDSTQKDIRFIQVGEEVITGLGTKRPVKCTFKQRCREKKAVKVKAKSLQEPLLVNHHHPFYVIHKEDFDLYNDSSATVIPDWVNAEDLKVGDWLLAPKTECDENSDITPAQARFLGYYAAEGFVVNAQRCKDTVYNDGRGRGWKWHQPKIILPATVKLTINMNEVDTLGKAIIDTAREAFGVNGHVEPKTENAVNIVIHDYDLASFCVSHVGKYSQQKKLSPELMNTSVEAKKQFIAAYADGDGDYRTEGNTGTIIIVTASPHLASQTQVMALSAGIMCRTAKYAFDYKGSKKYRWHVTIPSWSAQEVISRSCKVSHTAPDSKKIGATLLNDYAAYRITKLEYSEEDEFVYNLEVDAEGDEKSFIANGVITHNTDPFVGAAIDLHTDMPLSRIGFSLPILKNDPGQVKAKRCLKKVQKWSEHVNLFERLMEAFFEWHVVGNVYIFAEWDDKKKQWNRLTVLPPEEVSIVRFPFTDFGLAMYRPEPLIRLIFGVQENKANLNVVPPIDRMIFERLPDDILTSIHKFGSIIMDTDPSTGSFVAHLARKRSPYADLGVSALERVIIPLLQKEHFKYTQLSLASRLMTPRNKICAPGISPDATDFLRSEIDMSMEDPDYHIVTNFDFSWDVVNARDRLIDLAPEYERIENEILVALGITKELLTGEASYGGTRITLDILNTRYLLIRELFQSYVEKQLLYPMAVHNGWYEVDEETGEKEYYYPKLTFNRLAIRDNQEVFDALYQLYQKGSVPVKVIYELFNLDPNEMNDLLVEDLFTPRDSTFNELLRQVHTSLAEKVVSSTNVFDKVAGSLGLKQTDKEGKPVITPLKDLGSSVFMPPAEEERPAWVKEAPAEGPEAEVGTPAEETAPAEEAPAEEGAPVEETAPAEEAAPAAEAASTEEAAPVETTVPL
jgi:intein/homing endonuclease